MKLFKKLFPNKSAKERKAIEITLSDTHFQVVAPQQTAQLFAWSDMKEIRAVVEKDEDGDPFMLINIKFDDKEVLVPRGCKGYKSFKNKIIKLPDFASSSYHQATECTDTQQFILWRTKINPNSPKKQPKSQRPV